MVESFVQDPCSITYTIGDGKKVMKLDRYKIECNGAANMLFGFDNETYPGSEVDVNELVLTDAGKLHHQGYSPYYDFVRTELLEKMFAAARKCIAQ